MLPPTPEKLPLDDSAPPEKKKRGKPTPLKQEAIDKAPRPTEKVDRLWDTGGLYLELSPAGGRWWRFKYRIAGKEKRISLGTYPEVSLKKARKRRDEARVQVADDIDPSAERQTEKRRAKAAALNSFESVAREWYAKRRHIWSDSHGEDVLRRLEANLFPYIGARPISEIKAPELLAAVHKIEKRGAHDLAHRVMSVASQVFRFGVAQGKCEYDPAPSLRGALTPHKSKPQPAVKPEQVPDLMRAIRKYDTIGDSLTGLALQLLALTCVRTSELIKAEWPEFRDLDGKEPLWEVPEGREGRKAGGAHLVPLSRQAVAILRELKTLGGGSRYVLRGRDPDKHMSNNTMLFALYRMGYKGRQCGHGFRSVASTHLNESGKWKSDVIERALAHTERNKVRGAYNRAEYLPERRRMLQAWADIIDRMCADTKVPDLRLVG